MCSDLRRLFRQLALVRASFAARRAGFEREAGDLGIASGCFAGLEKAVGQLREVKAYIDAYSEDSRAHAAAQCEERAPASISFSNMNSHNLLKEVAKNMLVKNPRLRPALHGNGELFLGTAQAFPRLDLQASHVLAGVCSAFQEQLVLEEVFSMLKFQGVDMEAKFSEAYANLGIPGPRPEDRDSDCGLLEDAPYSEASIGRHPAEAEDGLHSMAQTYPLNFNSLELSEDAT